ncbi:MAG: lipoyl(octanoyl) transferase LipB [Bacteriovoracia bacterium]
MPYDEAWRLQLELVEARADGKISDTILFVEHPAVLTFGKKSPGIREQEALFPPEIGSVPVRLVERGGEATFHGPGQIVAYPILRLNSKFGPKSLLRALENALIATLHDFGVASYWIEGKTGVWLKDRLERERKIASLGVAVRRGVSYHGLALNVNTELENFRLISPCGFAPEVMTNLAECLDRPMDMAQVREALKKQLAPLYRQLELPEEILTP